MSESVQKLVPDFSRSSMREKNELTDQITRLKYISNNPTAVRHPHIPPPMIVQKQRSTVKNVGVDENKYYYLDGY